MKIVIVQLTVIFYLVCFCLSNIRKFTHKRFINKLKHKEKIAKEKANNINKLTDRMILILHTNKDKFNELENSYLKLSEEYNISKKNIVINNIVNLPTYKNFNTIFMKYNDKK